MAKKATAKRERNHPPAVVIGRPTLYKPEFDELVHRLALLGMTDLEICKFFEIGETTLHRWDQDHPSFRVSRVRAREEADADVAIKLYERAKGYSHKSEKIFMTRDGEIVRAETIEHYPPEVRAAELWLMNRQRAKWKPPQRDDAKSDERELTIKIVGGLPE